MLKRIDFCNNYFLLGIFLLFLCPKSNATSIEDLPIITFTDSVLQLKLPNDQIGFIEDFEGENNFESLDELDFGILPNKNLFDIAEKDFNYWVVFKLKNSSKFQKEWWLGLMGNCIDVQVTHENGEQESSKTGNLLKISDRAIPNKIRSYSYAPINIDAEETILVKLKVKVTGFFPFYHRSIQIGVPIHFQNSENNKLISQTFFDGLYGAILLMFCFYSFGLLLFTREIFALWAIALGLTYLGYFYQFNYTWYRLGLPPRFILIAGISLMHFSLLFDFLLKKTYLQTKVHFPFWDKLLSIGVWYSIILIIFHGAYHFFSENYITTIYSIRYTHFLVYIFRLAFAVVLIRHKTPLTMIYGVGLFLFNAIILVSALVNDAFIDDYYLHLFLKIGVITYITSIIFSLSYRAADSQKQKIKIEAERLFDNARLQELQKLDQVKSNFFANVSHELRTPLTLMLGPISSALKSDDLNNKNFTLLKVAQQSGKDLLKLIGSILDLSKMESGKIELVEKPVALFVFVRRIVSTFESYAQNENIILSFDYQAEKDLQLFLDGDKLEVVLNNLLSNALKFTPKGGEIKVVVRDKGNGVDLVVNDTGRGIHPDDLPHVFNRFYQSKQEDTPTEGGTGIGLALSQEFVKLMKGEIWVESVLGEGSTFYVKLSRREVLGMIEIPQTEQNMLPIIDENSRIIDPKLEPKEQDLNLSSILIVEDNKSLRNYISSVLSPFYQVVTKENGRIALDYLLQKDQALPNLILSDIMMPEMDGFQLLQTLKETDELKTIPIVMLTARADIEDKLKALRIGVDDYLLKPFEEEELLARIENLLRNAQERTVYNELVQEESVVITPSISQEETDWLIEIENLCQTHMSDTQFSIPRMASELAMSERNLQRQMKKLTGLTPNQYIQEIRLSHARNLLETKKFSTVSKVAYAVGFGDAKSFSRRYKKRFGKLPSEY